MQVGTGALLRSTHGLVLASWRIPTSLYLMVGSTTLALGSNEACMISAVIDCKRHAQAPNRPQKGTLRCTCVTEPQPRTDSGPLNPAWIPGAETLGCSPERGSRGGGP